MSVEALRKICSGETATPHRSTLEAIRNLLRKEHPDGQWRVAETPGPPPFGPAAELRKILPQGQEQAEAALEGVLAGMVPDPAGPEHAAAVADLLRNMLKQAYTGDDLYTRRRQRAARKKAAADKAAVEETPDAANEEPKPKQRPRRKEPDGGAA